MLKRIIVPVIFLGGCQTATYVKNAKMLSYDEDVIAGKSIGPVKGEDCVFSVFGNPLGKPPTLETALGKLKESKPEVRYLNNVKTEKDGFDIGIVGKNCFIVKAVGVK
jgi:hypothetical protein